MSTVEIPILDGTGQIPGALYGKGSAGGVARLDADGDVVNAAGSKITGGAGGGSVDSVNGKTGTVTLSAADVGAATSAQGAKADSAVQPDNLRLPLTKTQAEYDALTPVAGQVYIIQG